MTLTLVPSSPPARPPVGVGQMVRLQEPLHMPSGRTLRRGSYEVLDVEATPAEHRQLGVYRLVIEAVPDCTGLPETHRPGSEYRRRKGLPSRPYCARRQRFYLYPGMFTSLRDDQEVTIPDHPLQND